METRGGSALVVGRVISRSGNAQEAAHVRAVLVERDGFLERFVSTEVAAGTDAEGRFALVGVPAGKPIGVEVTHPDFAPAIVAPFRVAAADERDIGDIVLQSGTTMRGRVTDTDEAPLPDATIEIYDFSRPTNDPGALAGAAVTGSDGVYEIHHLAQRQYTVMASREGYAPVETVLSFVLGSPAAGWEQDFILEEAALPLGGTVFDDQDQPVPDVGLRLVRRAFGSAAYFSTSRRSDADGRFLFEALPEGKFDLTVESPSHYLAANRKIESGDTEKRIYVKPALSVLGRLVAAPMPTAFRVTAKPDARTGAGLLDGVERTQRFQPDEIGTFLFTGLKPGTYTFEVAAPGYAPTSSHDV